MEPQIRQMPMTADSGGRSSCASTDADMTVLPITAEVWPPPAVPAPEWPAPQTVAVYAFDLDHPRAVVRRMERLLTDDEIDRAGRFLRQELRHRYIVGRAGLRIGLGAALRTAPAALRFEYGPHGKPTLPGTQLRYNLSHSDGVALLALATDAEVGVDVEAISTDIELDDMAGRFFSPRERVAYRRFDPADRPAAFFRCWTRKEAVIKAVGDGLSLPLDRFDVDIGTDNPRVMRFLGNPRPDDWTLLHVEAGHGYAGAVAVRAPGYRLVARRWDPALTVVPDQASVLPLQRPVAQGWS
jgi:4'-phosphopantetheinyl transferase